MATLVLKAGREKSLRRLHPWVFSRAVAEVSGNPRPGETVEVCTADGTLLGRGAYSPRSQITVRMWTFDPDEEVDPAFFRLRMTRALEMRRPLLAGSDLTAYRLINAESDGLPGLIVDRYADYLVCQFSTAGAEHWRGTIVSCLEDLISPRGIYDRSDLEVRRKENLRESSGVLSGQEPPDLIDIQEGSSRFLVDVRNGHKTGFYLDQRENRVHVASYTQNAEVLNCFSYTGGFGISAMHAGAARIVNVDTSAPALALARRNAALNNTGGIPVDYVEGNVFHVLRNYRDEGRQFDVIILDPPKFADSRGQVQRASRGYKDINLLAFALLRPGGMLFTFSCSGSIDRNLFQKIVAGAALDAGRHAQIVGWLFQAPDHPVALHFPEGEYLKGLECRVW